MLKSTKTRAQAVNTIKFNNQYIKISISDVKIQTGQQLQQIQCKYVKSCFISEIPTLQMIEIIQFFILCSFLVYCECFWDFIFQLSIFKSFLIFLVVSHLKFFLFDFAQSLCGYLFSMIVLKSYFLNSFQKSLPILLQSDQQMSSFMNKYTTAQITISKNHEKKQLFLKDQKSDIFLILNNRIFPLHLNVIERCSQFLERLKPGQRVYFIENKFNSQIFEKVLASLYGYQLKFSRNIQVVKILDVAKFLGIQEIQQAVYEDINLNFEQYGPILLFKISRSFGLSWLYKRCLETFVSLKFQQFFINKFDLMNSDQSTFEEILKNHQILKSKKVVQGIQHESIIKIIQQYSEINSTKVDIQQVLSISAEDEQQTQKMLRSIDYDHQIKNDRIRKRKSTWNCSASRLNDSLDGQEKAKKKQKKEEKNNKYQELKEVNLQIQNRISSTTQEIKETKTQMQKCSFESKQINQLGLLVKDLQKTFDQQSKKLNILKEKTLQLSGRKSRKNSPENEKISNY